MTPAASIVLNLDHVNVECQENGSVIVRCVDVQTSTISVWVMRRAVDGWDMTAGSVNAEMDHSVALN